MGFFDDFFGSSQRKDIQKASAAAQQQYEQGLKKFKSTTNEFLDRSVDFLEPDIAAGRDATAILRAANGLDGPDAQRAFFANFQQDPGVQAVINAGIEGLDNSAASRGALFSGAQLRDVGDFVGRQTNQMFQQRLNRLFDLGNVGSTQATNAAQLTSTAGSNIAGAQFGTGQLQANNLINTGNAVAQSRGIGINNLLGVANAGAKIAGAFMGAPA